MKEIEVGEYVRTKRGDIDKIDRYIFESNIYHCKNGLCIDTENRIGLHLEDITKHSKNVIDLIEINDIVKALDINWIRVFKLDNQEEIEIFKEELQENNYKLLAIVTKEQFKQIEYRLED